MKYYPLHFALTEIGRGGYPQAQNAELVKGKQITDFIVFKRPDGLPSFQQHVGTIVLRDGSAVTDFFSAAMISFAFPCSTKVEQIVRQHQFGDTQFDKLGVKHKGVLYDYRVMASFNNYADKIDYRQSEFRRIKIENNQRVSEKYSIENLADVIETKKQLSVNQYGDWCYLEPFTIKFRDDFNPVHDIFIIWGVTHDTYISEPLRQAFEKANITGISFQNHKEPISFM